MVGTRLGRVRGIVGKGWGECGAWLGKVGASAMRDIVGKGWGECGAWLGKVGASAGHG